MSEQKGGNVQKVAAVGKGLKFSFAGLWSCASDACSLSEVVGSCFLLRRKMLSGQNHREGAALTTGRCDVALNSTLSDSQPGSRAARAHDRSRHQPLVFIIFISLKTLEGFQSRFLFGFLGEYMDFVVRDRAKRKEERQEMFFFFSTSEFQQVLHSHLNTCVHTLTKCL